MNGVKNLRIGVLIFALSVGHLAMAQGLKIGIKGGMNVSDFSIKTNAFESGLKSMWKPLILSHIGGTVEKPLNHVLGIQGELLYAINGSNLQFTKSYAHFLSIPVLLNVYVNKHIVLEAGPQVSVIYKSKKSILLIDSKYDLAAVIGCRVRVSPRVDIGLRFVQGVAPLGNLFTADTQGNSRSIHDFYSRNLQLSVVYQLVKGGVISGHL